MPICMILGDGKSNSFYYIQDSFTELSPLILNSTVHCISIQFLSSMNMGYMKKHILISVCYDILNKMSKKEICRLSNYESHFA